MTQLQIKCVESKINEARDNHATFIMESFEKGHGITVGNALRRIMLSDLQGTAITAVRIANVNHEFSSIPGVREDIIEILLNLKEVVFKGFTSNTAIGRLKVQGPGIIMSGQFELPNGIEVVDPTQYIATLSEKVVLEIEVRITSGKGYDLSERLNKEIPTDFLQVDAVYMPVKKVNYNVELVEQNPSILKDRLILDVWTNGSISPQEAVTQSSQNLIELFTPLSNFSGKSNATTTPIVKRENQVNQILIEELHLSVRAYNCLKRAQIHSVADLIYYSREDLLEIKNFGEKSAQEVIDALQKRLGIKLPAERINSKPL